MSSHRVIGLLVGALVLSTTGAVTLGAPFANAPGSALSGSSINAGSFASYLLFTQIHTSSDGSPMWFTSDAQLDGPVHTNGEFRFFYQPYFGDRVSSVNSKAW